MSFTLNKIELHRMIATSQKLTMILALMILPLGQSSFASWFDLPLEVLIDESDIIVIGKVMTKQTIAIKGAGKSYDVVMIEGFETLKGSVPEKELRIIQKDLSTPPNSSDIMFSIGLEGGFILIKSQHNGFYEVTHPYQYQPSSKTAWLKQLVASRATIEGGQQKYGLVARLEVYENDIDEHKIPLPKFLRLSVENKSRETITILYSIQDHPIKVSWITPDLISKRSEHYDLFKRPKQPSPPISISIPAGGIRYVGPLAPYQPILFSPLSDDLYNSRMNIAAPGTHHVRMTLRTTIKKEDSTDSFVDLTSNEVVFTVEK